jgi:thioredoxin 1
MPAFPSMSICAITSICGTSLLVFLRPITEGLAPREIRYNVLAYLRQAFCWGLGRNGPDPGRLNPIRLEFHQVAGERKMAGDNTLTFTDGSFDTDVLNSDVPVLVDFWAEWCGPCRMMGPTVDQVASDYAGKVKVGKLDVDSNQQTAMRYGIRGIPTLLLFKGGKVIDQKVGAIGKPEFQKMLNAHVTTVVAS